MGSTPVTTSNSSATGTILAKPNLLQGILALQDDGGYQVLDLLKDESVHYVFIDEVQLCAHFEEVLASLSKRQNIDLYVTGSNAYLLSGELATFLTGRYTKVEMLPLSFKEFRQAVLEDGLSEQEDFERYLQISSFPALVRDRDDPEHIDIYYSDLIQSIILKDISWRLKLRDTGTLFRLCCFLS